MLQTKVKSRKKGRKIIIKEIKYKMTSKLSVLDPLNKSKNNKRHFMLNIEQFRSKKILFLIVRNKLRSGLAQERKTTLQQIKVANR